MMLASENPPVTVLQLATVLHTTEEICTVMTTDTRLEVRYADFFPTPRVERVAPGHLVAMSRTGTGQAVIVWRWFDAVVQEAGDRSIHLWEPAHGFVVAQPRTPTRAYRPGTRAYLSAGLPGAQWWVAGPVTEHSEDADVEVAEVRAFLDGLGFSIP